MHAWCGYIFVSSAGCVYECVLWDQLNSTQYYCQFSSRAQRRRNEFCADDIIMIIIPRIMSVWKSWKHHAYVVTHAHIHAYMESHEWMLNIYVCKYCVGGFYSMCHIWWMLIFNGKILSNRYSCYRPSPLPLSPPPLPQTPPSPRCCHCHHLPTFIVSNLLCLPTSYAHTYVWWKSTYDILLSLLLPVWACSYFIRLSSFYTAYARSAYFFFFFWCVELLKSQPAVLYLKTHHGIPFYFMFFNSHFPSNFVKVLSSTPWSCHENQKTRLLHNFYNHFHFSVETPFD